MTTYLDHASNTHVCQYCGTSTDQDGRDYYGNSVCKAWQTILHVIYKRV